MMRNNIALVLLLSVATITQALPQMTEANTASMACPSSVLASTNPVLVAPGIGFTLANRSLKSIPLQIPGVMNPNLSPMSNSGLSLAVGQEVFFFEGKKKHLLLVVRPEFEGQTLIVDDLIKERLEQIRAEEAEKAASKKRSKHGN